MLLRGGIWTVFGRPPLHERYLDDRATMAYQPYMVKSQHSGRPPPTILGLLVDHQRWLNSAGRAGKRLEKDELQFNDCDLDGINLSGAQLRYAYFEGGSVRLANFTGADLYRATFASCDVAEANFSQANLRSATFLTNHREARFDGANLDHVAWNAEEEKRNQDERRTSLRTRMGFLSKLGKGTS
jgi:hypothetical protein